MIVYGINYVFIFLFQIMSKRKFHEREKLCLRRVVQAWFDVGEGIVV